MSDKWAVELGGQKVQVDFDNKILYFILEKGYVHGLSEKYDWPTNIPSIGLNNEILEYALRKNLIIKVTYKDDVWFINLDAIRTVVDNNWLVKKIHGLIIYAVPLFLAKRSLEATQMRPITSYV